MSVVVDFSGKQYNVEVGSVLYVDKVDAEVGSDLTINSVIAKFGEEVRIGSPYVENSSVVAKVIKHGKKKKIIVYKFKPKRGYKRKQGHRQQYTKIEITNIA